MTLQLTDTELNRMARSRSRNLLAEIGRQADDDLYGTTVRQSMIITNGTMLLLQKGTTVSGCVWFPVRTLRCEAGRSDTAP